ncbi:MAG TPA: CcmD family protein [Elusimicrobia bacterium]|jgi:CcmD family protein|nr:CcmD family protein [Elusimicrobiota bacterium]
MNQGLTYLFLAYTVIWIAIFFYLLSLSRKISTLRKEIDSLKK